jgi:hypothetical protein
MEIIPLASESLGVRSMATYIQTRGMRIVIDPGVSLCPNRFGLPPHEREKRRGEDLWRRVRERVAASDIIIITHYHYDHFEPKEIEIYKGKTLYVKHPNRQINYSQKRRASDFLNKVKGLVEEVSYVDGLRLDVGSVEITFSNPVYHGAGPMLGFVLEVCVEGDERFLFTSDVQGPALREQIGFIVEKDPETLYVDGPMTYMLGEAYPREYLEAANRNLMEIIERTNVKRLIVDHHLTRDLNYRSWISQVYDLAGGAGVSLVTAAEFLGEVPDLLEARRRELYQEKEGENAGK